MFFFKLNYKSIKLSIAIEKKNENGVGANLNFIVL